METFAHTFLIDHTVAIKDDIFSKTNTIFPSTFTALVCTSLCFADINIILFIITCSKRLRLRFMGNRTL